MSNGDSVLRVVVDQSRRVLETYRVDPGLIQEHANNERRIEQGGYGDRQVFELVQNGADEMHGRPGGEVAIVLTATHLYCANEGAPVTADGADTILRMGVSRKRGGQIGRFGVGVKSVLAISDTPQFFSRADGADFGFGFDREWSAEEIRKIHPEAGETPVLRMAKVLDPARERAADPILDDLMGWATTVVRLPLKTDGIARLGRDLVTFPIEFPLFSGHVGVVTLEDRRSGQVVKRQIFQQVRGDAHTLEEVRPNGESIHHPWRVFTRTHAPSETALRAAGELHDRPRIEISWAVPERSRERGEFWAYFPTKFKTTLRGILNAPWKTSEDRQAIFDGNAFNDELLQVAAELVVDSLPLLSKADDPTNYLDYLPGRGREAPQFADESLTRAIWKVAAERPSIPDQNGAFRTPHEIRLHPAGLAEEWLRLWSRYEGRPSNWVHHSMEQRERRARVVRIFDKAEVGEAGVQEWLEALARDGSPAASAIAVRIVADMKRKGSPLLGEALRARVVLTRSHGMVPPTGGTVFRRSSEDELQDDLVYVDERVLDDFDVTSALDELGIRDADASGRFAAVVDRGLHGYDHAQWTAFWELSRGVGSDRVLTTLQERLEEATRKIKVLTVHGDFRPIHECLIPGPVVPADGSRDAAIAVDMRFHAPDRVLLHELGLTDRPALDHDPRGERYFDDYVEAAWGWYVKTLDDKARRPQKGTMRVDGANPAGPLDLLLRLSPEGRAAYLRHLPTHGLVPQWTIQAGRQLGSRMVIDSPLVWMARDHGRLKTSQGLARVPRSVGPTLARYSDVLPVADVPTAVADLLGLPSALGEVPASLWRDALISSCRSESDEYPGRVYALLRQSGRDWPEDVPVRCRVGDTWSSEIPRAEIAVTEVRAEFDALVRETLPALLVPDEETAVWMRSRWSLLDPADLIQKEVQFEVDSEPVLLLDEFPHLRSHRQIVEGWRLIRCRRLEEVTRTPKGMRTAPLKRVVHEHSVLVLRPEGDLDALIAVDVLLKLGLGEQRCRSILELRQKQLESKRIRAIRAAETEEKKLLELVGEAQLRAGLPEGLMEAETARTGRQPDGVRVARLAMDAYGDGVLRHYSKDIAARNEEAPSHFSGSTTSLRFVKELGLPDSYAGVKMVTPPEMEDVDGPTDFPRLHDYQDKLVSNMLWFLQRPTPGRAMLRLPTGAGKTRVAVEAVIRLVRERGVKGPILWIAQSNELCEQAVESWKFVWSKVGPRQRLTVNRFWGDNDAAPVDANPQLVVATDAKLHRRLKGEAYAWLRDAALVIVDEAHGALSERYTEIFERLGLDRSQTARPLIGLTATPYRTDADETRRLANRFGTFRLDDGVFGDEDPVAALQKLEVLAQVDHRELKGSTLSLDEKERAEADTFGVLPPSAEHKLAMNDERNQMLLDEIAGLPEDWQILVFATSVNHAKLLTAMLNGRGVRSASIDSFTPAFERRNVIEDYRAKRIRVLTNYGVLAQGFDAPATRAVVIARPTYSAAMYQQMIGRGLRGPRNGGEKRCQILDVSDNIENFGKSLAFTGFEGLWGMR
ncbi:DEAD/DEAH box helicase [Actinomadura logoneensis]|uniref:DEAD/DEAH box helicase n=1 Tax=Actinomadura logoneensis TaxID=2293572 RepID=A0A372JQY2_9ACTN|nr:DEAD/DEAH box helicase [Actinomadura logoneensis]RFU42349.1 DEAD/DEAH box helicase [Actinomadura logoneensis]